MVQLTTLASLLPVSTAPRRLFDRIAFSTRTPCEPVLSTPLRQLRTATRAIVRSVAPWAKIPDSLASVMLRSLMAEPLPATITPLFARRASRIVA